MATIHNLVSVGAVLAGLCLITTPAQAQARDDCSGSTCQRAKAAAAKPSPLKLAPGTKAKTSARAASSKKAARTAPAAGTARGGDEGVIMRGQDSISLIAMLPWWRADEAQAHRSRLKEAESPVLAATQAWLTSPLAAIAVTDAGQLASAADVGELAADAVNVVDPDDVNEIDLAAAGDHQPANQSWLHGLLAILGGALAAASTARFLLV
jgi:aryl carrier-like protein